ncbi:MAG TPA: flagellar hook capping FlgD N-terminal domain-containing protein, partial [Longimicrobiaceae bacterium]|nr:flagellar hook capping FlgD N-terminal domain-containing protein [Longimicrobiaceae bacterium]
MTTAVGSTTSGAATAAAAASKPITSAPGGAMGKDQFIQLLVAQMSHQDPLNPMDGQQLASQLAQFSSVEQLMQINESLTAQNSAQAAIVSALNSNSAIGAFGKTVTALGNALVVSEGQPESSVSFSVGGQGGA